MLIKYRIRFVCLFLTASCWFVASATAQATWTQAQQTALVDLNSDDATVRSRALPVLLNRTRSAERSVGDLLRQYPEHADEVKTALIAALDKEAAYRAKLEAEGGNFSEEFSSYYGDLLTAVASLRDARAIAGLANAVDTGGIAANALADLGTQAIPAVTSKRDSENSAVRMGAVFTLGKFLLRQDTVRTNQDAVSTVQAALIDSLDDPAPLVRAAAVSALRPLVDDPVIRSRVERLSADDLYESEFTERDGGTRAYIVRERALRVLASREEDEFYVVRGSQRDCEVQLGVEGPSELLIGPLQSRALARIEMCRQFKGRREDSVPCWQVDPSNACSR